MSSQHFKVLELDAYHACDQYIEKQFEDRVSPVYFRDLDDGFVGVILLKDW